MPHHIFPNLGYLLQDNIVSKVINDARLKDLFDHK